MCVQICYVRSLAWGPFCGSCKFPMEHGAESFGARKHCLGILLHRVCNASIPHEKHMQDIFCVDPFCGNNDNVHIPLLEMKSLAREFPYLP